MYVFGADRSGIMIFRSVKELEFTLVYIDIINTIDQLPQHSSDTAGPESVTLRKGLRTDHEQKLIDVNIILGSEGKNSLKIVMMPGEHVELSAIVGILCFDFDGILEIVKAETGFNIPGVKMEGFGAQVVRMNQFYRIVMRQAEYTGGVKQTDMLVYFQDGISAGEQNDGAAILERQSIERIIEIEFNRN